MAASSLYITAEPGAGSAEVDTCTLEINSKYEVVTSIVCSAFFSLGFIYCFFGTYNVTSVHKFKVLFKCVCCVRVFHLTV